MKDFLVVVKGYRVEQEEDPSSTRLETKTKLRIDFSILTQENTPESVAQFIGEIQKLCKEFNSRKKRLN